MKEPLVSVIVPAFNAAATLAETLASVAGQSWRALEILIVDDGSTDDTAAVARAFCAGEPRARLICTENRGVAAARNRALAEARGAWIAPMDADDLWHEERVARMVAAGEGAAERPGFVYCRFRVIDERNRVIASGDPWAVEGRALVPMLYRNFVGNGSGLLLCREAALAVGGFDESLRACGAEGCDDLAIQLWVAREFSILCVPLYLVGYRLEGAMSRDSERMQRSCALAAEAVASGRAARRALRWNRALGMVGQAERAARRGARAQATRLIAGALLRDPARTGLYLSYRAVRVLARSVRGRRPAVEAPAFAEVDPAARICGDPDGIGWIERALERFEAARMERLKRRGGRE
jgi:hypothetical protein